ncbi:MAG: phosphoribosylanthranilate isomerase [Gemmatimonadetes bacterium]|nr:phosphoribosylanthranilate isomerase [Gemmatimonadota bacterium]
MTIRIKVCGVTDPNAAMAAVAAGADFLGLVFAASIRGVSPDRARRLVSGCPARWVGVFVDPSIEEVSGIASTLDLAALQLHGRESPGFCRDLRSATGRPVWKALPWTGAADSVHPYDDGQVADAILLDTPASLGEEGGGTGRALPWKEIAERMPPEKRSVPLFLAGGLDSTNVRRAIDIVRPEGVDASSRLESAPGVKDPALIRAFVTAARVTRAGLTARHR